METGTTSLMKDRPGDGILHVTFELDDLRWTLTMGTQMGRPPRQRRVRPRDRAAVLGEIEETKRRFGIVGGRTVSCYEAGREGFWLHRWLVSEGIENRVVDSASIEVNRRKRRVKADRIDGKKLLRMLMRYEAGEKGVWSVVRVPSVEAEDARHLHRELTTLKRARVRVTNRIKGLLATQGVRPQLREDFLERIDAIRLWDGSRLPPRLQDRLQRGWERRAWLSERILLLERNRRELLRSSKTVDVEQVRQLLLLDGIGENSAWVFVTEFFGWRRFNNRREVGGLAGVTPANYQSGATSHDQGISKAGNRHVRHMAVQVAWAWLRHQPDSALSRWYNRKYGAGNPSLRKTGIVALARRLLIELWRYLETGAIPEGATLKT
jgi:transposase